MRRRISSVFIVFFFLFSTIAPSLSLAQVGGAPISTAPGGAIISTFVPSMVKGVTIFPDNPLRFDFIVEPGDSGLQDNALKEESSKLIKYFLAALTVPEGDMWVNLSPYEKNRIIPSAFGKTEMGRDLLAQDYLLKQMTASLMSPDNEIGASFWDKIYERIYELYGVTELPVETFNKVWIVPESATVQIEGNTVYVTESQLKVLTDTDYKSAQEYKASSTKHGGQASTQDSTVGADLASARYEDNRIDAGSTPVGEETIALNIIKSIIIPALEKEVNNGKTFAPLRQIYNAVILATWYKKNLKKSFLGHVYADKNKIAGVEYGQDSVGAVLASAREEQSKSVHIGKQENIASETLSVESIYNKYLELFKTGVYNTVREDYDPVSKEIIPRKYFSGGARLDAGMVYKEKNTVDVKLSDNAMKVKVDLVSSKDKKEVKAFAKKHADNMINMLLVQAEKYDVDIKSIVAKLKNKLVSIIINDVTLRDGIQAIEAAHKDNLTPEKKLDFIQKMIVARIPRGEFGALPNKKLFAKGFLKGVENSEEVASLVQEKISGIESEYLLLRSDAHKDILENNPNLTEASYNVALSIMYAIKNLNLRTGKEAIDKSTPAERYEYIMSMNEDEKFSLIMNGFKDKYVESGSIEAMIRNAVTREGDEPFRIRIYPSNSFGYSYEKDGRKFKEAVPVERLTRFMDEMTEIFEDLVKKVANEENVSIDEIRKLVNLEFAISDTSGEVTDPEDVKSIVNARKVFQAIKRNKNSKKDYVGFALHLQDRGLGPLVSLVFFDEMLELGKDLVIDVSLGYTGGSPFSKNAPGNVGIEDLLVWFSALGIKTKNDIDLNAVLDLSRQFVESLGVDDFMERGAVGFHHLLDNDIVDIVGTWSTKIEDFYGRQEVDNAMSHKRADSIAFPGNETRIIKKGDVLTDDEVNELMENDIFVVPMTFDNRQEKEEYKALYKAADVVKVSYFSVPKTEEELKPRGAGPEDGAMTGSSILPIAADVQNEKDVGGIDLNPNSFDIKSEGEDINFNFDFDINNFNAATISGFTPVIFQMTPVNSR